jgi:hypothetical protein
MKQDMRKGGSQVKALLNRLAAEKKKSAIALCLIGVMVLMWVKMLAGGAPEEAGAAPKGHNAPAGGANSKTNVVFAELPKVEGRNDVLTRDFFAANDWVDFTGDRTGANQVNISDDDNEKLVRRIAGRLKVEAVTIGSGDNPQVSINGKQLSIGDTLTIREGVNAYECEVAGINENTVLIRFRQAQITLQLVKDKVNE